jgi:replicative DNA helicase
LGKTLDAMKALNAKMQPAFVMDGIEDFIQKRQLMMAIEQAADLAHNGDLAAAREALAGGNAYTATSEGIWFADEEAMTAFMDVSDEDRFPLGIEELDRLGVQPARGAMFLLIAPPKKGKSWFLVHAGKTGLQYRKNVLHISLENSAKLTAQRYLQSMFALKQNEGTSVKVARMQRKHGDRVDNIEVEELVKSAGGSPLRAATLAHKQAIIKKMKAFKKRARLRIEFFPSGTLTMGMLNALLDKLDRVDGFKPDMLILDYPDLMAIDRKNLRIDLGSIFVQLRGVAGQRNFALVTATQGGREGALAHTVNTTHVSEDFSKVMTADVIVTYSQTAKEKKSGLARLFVALSRISKDGFIILISQAYAIGQFCLDSTFMGEHIEQHIERLFKSGDGED